MDNRLVTSEMVHKAYRKQISLFPQKNVTLSQIRNLLEMDEIVNGLRQSRGESPTIIREMLLGD